MPIIARSPGCVDIPRFRERLEAQGSADGYQDAAEGSAWQELHAARSVTTCEAIFEPVRALARLPASSVEVSNRSHNHERELRVRPHGQGMACEYSLVPV
jgi:hypothetical protein